MLLAKSNPPRSYVDHSLDVAEAAALRVSEPVLRARLSTAAGIPITDVHAARLAVLAGLHDIGKIGAGFQRMLAGERSAWKHVAGGLAAVRVLQSEIRDVLSWWSDPAAALYASICHHGGPVAMRDMREQAGIVREHVGAESIDGLRDLLAALRDAYPDAWEAAPVLQWTPALDHLVAGIVMGADWVGSGAYEDVKHAYRAAGIRGRQDHRLLEGLRLRPLQEAIGRVPLDERLIIVEDGTGSGKTEAAMVHAERLAGAGLISGIYFAVPTRSAATELHARIAGYLDAVPGLRGTVTRVVPGQIDTDGWQGRRPWHLGGSRQAMMARVGVGTIDQAMLSVMAVRHGWMRAAWLADRLLVIDEVHASDSYMEAVVGSLVRRHLELGGHVLCLSATLGESMRSRLLGHPPVPPEDADRTPYPVIWAGSSPVPVDPVTRREIQIEFTDGLVQDAARAAAGGAVVLIIRSTVGEAVETWKSIRALGAEPLLHHSRWADDDRRHLDAEVLRRIGSTGRIPGSIIVGTQTLEQSLDIDADLLITDACPADVLLQRLGRLHRHDRERPAGYGSPRALLLEPGDLAQYVSDSGRISGRPGQGWAWVYPVLSVAATVGWVRANGRVRVPEDSRALVERATHPDHLQEVADRMGIGWQRIMVDAHGNGIAERQQGGLAVVDWSVPYQRAQVDSYPTRLGDGNVTVETPGLLSPLTAHEVPAVPVPARWLRGVDQDTPATVDGQTITIGSLAMRYGEQGLQKL